MVKGVVLLLVILLILVVIVVKGSGLPRRLVQEHLLMSFRTQILGTQRRGDGKDCAPPSSAGEGGEVGVPRNLFPRLGGWVNFCTGEAWNLLSEGTGLGFFPAGQSSRRGPVHWHWSILISCT